MDSPQIMPPIERANNSLGDSYLSFQLARQIPALLLMEYAQEIVIVPTNRLTLVPNMPGCVLGLLNRRGRVLWIVNLAQLLNLPVTEPTNRQYQIIIIHTGQVKLGLAVQSIKGVTRFPHHHRQAPTELFSHLAPYLSGCITQGEEILVVLDIEKIANSSNLQPY